MRNTLKYNFYPLKQVQCTEQEIVVSLNVNMPEQIKNQCVYQYVGFLCLIISIKKLSIVEMSDYLTKCIINSF